MEEFIFLWLTRLTVIIHFLFIIFVIIGGFFINRKWWIIYVHLLAVIWAIYAELAPGVICPLTAMENYLGLRAGISTYEEDFITRYLIPIIYQETISMNIQIVLVILVIVINTIAYIISFRKKRTPSHFL
jgi:hypothetical protein